jgi:membrane-associated phospholipid phosphatase
MLDSITYGNPTQRQIPFIEATSPLDKHIPQLTKFGFPLNSSKATREELNLLVDYIADLKADPETLQRYKTYDHEIERTFASVVMEHGLGDAAVEIIDRLIDESLPLIIKLKYHFQRPRPYQLAQHYKLKLFPFDSYTAATPSYPAGHTLQANLLCYVLGNTFPDKYDYFEALAQDITYSRMYMGLHYPSDNDFAQYCVELISKDKEFKQRYNL